MKKSVEDLNNEEKVILLTSYAQLSEEQINTLQELLAEKLNWSEILYMAVSHRTLNILYYHLKNLKMTSVVNKEVHKLMRNSFNVYAVRNQILYDEIYKIASGFNEKNLNYAVLKGVYLSDQVYPCIETRTFNDIDLLIDVKSSKAIAEVLEGNGFIQGEYNMATDEIIPCNRTQKIYHQLATHELMPFNKKTGNPFVPVIQVDLNYTLLWKGNCPYNIETNDLLKETRIVDINGKPVRTLSIVDFILQLAFHLYREATSVNVISIARDLQLYKFMDIAMIIQKSCDEHVWKSIIERANEFNCKEVFYYVFYYLNILYPDVVPKNVMEQLEVEDKCYLNQYGLDGNELYEWKEDFLTRLFKDSRADVLSKDVFTEKNNFYKNKDLL